MLSFFNAKLNISTTLLLLSTGNVGEPELGMVSRIFPLPKQNGSNSPAIKTLPALKYLLTGFSDQVLTLMFPETSLALLNEAAEEASANYDAVYRVKEEVSEWHTTFTNIDNDASGRKTISLAQCNDLENVLNRLGTLLKKELRLFGDNDALRNLTATKNCNPYAAGCSRKKRCHEDRPSRGVSLHKTKLCGFVPAIGHTLAGSEDGVQIYSSRLSKRTI